MVTISIPINSKQEKFIDSLIKSGKVANKAHAVRQALDFMAEEEAIQQILKSQEDVMSGRVFGGDLRELVEKF